MTVVQMVIHRNAQPTSVPVTPIAQVLGALLVVFAI